MSEIIVPSGNGSAEITEKRSRFIAFARYAETEREAAEQTALLKKIYWDAKHVVYAYVAADGTSRSSDDGEPHGTAGKPLLGVITGANVRCCLIAVVRYFGGILLGTGGLVRAYGEAGRLALENAGLARLVNLDLYSVSCGYESYRKLSSLIETEGGTEQVADFGEQVTVRFSLPFKAAEGFTKSLTDAFSGSLKMIKIGEKQGKIPILGE